jgi:hypothetical protein
LDSTTFDSVHFHWFNGLVKTKRGRIWSTA